MTAKYLQGTLCLKQEFSENKNVSGEIKKYIRFYKGVAIIKVDRFLQ